MVRFRKNIYAVATYKEGVKWLCILSTHESHQAAITKVRFIRKNDSKYKRPEGIDPMMVIHDDLIIRKIQ